MENPLRTFIETRASIHGEAQPAPWKAHDFGTAGSDEPQTIVIFEGDEFNWQDVHDGELIVTTPSWEYQEHLNTQAIVDAHNNMPQMLEMLQRVLDLCDKNESIRADDIRRALEEVINHEGN